MSDVVSKITIALNDQASSGMKGIGAEVDNLRGKVSSFGSALSNIGTGIGISAGMAGLSGISDVLSEGFSTSLRIENLDATYSAIYDGAAKAKQELAFIRAEADRLGLSFLDTADSAKMFFASSKGSSIEKDAKDIFSAFSELAVTMRLSKEQTSGMFLALGQSASKGKLMAQELREQLGEKVPGIFRVIADSLGVTTTQLDKMLEEGKVGLDALAKAVPVIRERFGSALPEAVNSTTAAIGRLNTKWDDLMAHSANTDMLKTGINGLTAVIGTLDSGMAALSEHSDMLSSVALGLGAGYAALTVKKKLLNQESLTAIKNAVSESSVMGTLKQSVLDAASADFRLAQSHNAAAKAALTQAQRTEERLMREKNILANSFKIVQGETNKAAVLSKMAVLEGRLSGAIKERSAAERMAKAATDALVNASKNVNTAYEAVASGGLNKATKGMNLLKTAGTGLMNLFGGPWGVALTAATAGITYLSTRQTEGERISEKYAGKQLEVEEVFKRLATAAKTASKETDNISASQEKLDKSKAIEEYKSSLKELESLSHNMRPSQFSGMTDSINGVDEVRRKTVELLEAVRTGKGDVMGLAKEIDQLGTQSDAAATLSTKIKTALESMCKAGREAGGEFDILGGYIRAMADEARNAKAVIESPWVLNIDGALKGIDAMRKTIRSLQAERLGMKDSSELVDLFPKLGVEQIERAQKAFKDEGWSGAVLALGDGFQRLSEKEQLAIHKTFLLDKQKRTEIATTDAWRKAQREAAKDHTSAYNQMENNLASYTSELNQTKSSIHSLQAQLATKPGEVFTREQNKIAADYRATVEKINAEATKYANKKGITKTQAEELKQSKLQEASLQKNLDLRLAQEKEEKRLADLAKDKYDFYKELEAISGEYGLSLQFQNEMIAAQAKELEHLELPQRYMEQWKELKALQMSHDWADGAQRAFLQYRADATDAAKGAEEAFSGLYSGMDSGWKSAWEQMIETGKVSLSSFRSVFASFLADLMHMAITRPITVQIAGVVSGMLGTDGVAYASGGSGGVGGMSDLSGLSNLMPGSWTSGIADTINNTMAGWFPSTFASTSAVSSAANAGVMSATGGAADVAGLKAAEAASSLGGNTTFLSTVSPYLMAGGLGSLGYTMLGGALGLPQSKYSGLTAGLGGAAGWGLGSLAAGSFASIGATMGSVVPVVGTIIGALAGGALGSLFGQERKTHPSVYGHMMDQGYTTDTQTYIDAFMNQATYDRAGKTEASAYAQVIGEAASQSAGNILNLAAMLPEEYKKSVEDQLESATWSAGRGYSGASWNLQNWKEGMAEERIQEAVDDMFEQMGYGANKAFAEAGIGDLFTTFDLSTEEGFKKAQTAISAISSITTAIDEIKAPTSEAEQQAKAFVAQMNALGEAVKASGLNAAYADEMLSDYRTAYVDNYVNSLEEMFNPLSQIEQQAKGYKEAIDGYVAALTTMGASEAQLAQVRGYTQDAIDNITGSLGAAFFPLSSVEQQTKSTMESLLAYKAALETLGASAEEMTRIDAAWGKMQADLLDKVRAYVSTTPEVVSQAAAMNAEFDALREAMLLAGNATADLTELEQTRAQAVAALQAQYAESFRQTYAQRYATLTGDTNGLANLQQQASFSSELAEIEKTWGKDSEQYRQMQALQDAEAAKQRLQQAQTAYAALQAQLEKQQAELKQLEQQAVQLQIEEIQKLQTASKERIAALEKELSAAQKLHDTWEDVFATAYAKRVDLYQGNTNLDVFGRLDTAQGEFDRLYGLAIGGDADAAKEMAGVASELLGLRGETTANRDDYLDAFYDVDKKLKEVSAYADAQVSDAQKQIDTLQAQLEAENAQYSILVSQLSAQQAALSALNGQTQTLASIQAQIAKLKTEINITIDGKNVASSTVGNAQGDYDDAKDHVDQTKPVVGIYGSKYLTEYDLLVAKVASLNRGEFVNADADTRDWTVAKARQAMIGEYGSVKNWYLQIGKPVEGFERGGLATPGGPKMFGERGIEYGDVEQPTRIYDATKTRLMLEGGHEYAREAYKGMAEFSRMLARTSGARGDGNKEETAALRKEVRELRGMLKAMLTSVVKNTKDVRDFLEEFEETGLPPQRVNA